jgi:PAS domain S-box-containing protein
MIPENDDSGREQLAAARLLAAIVETSDDAIVSKSLDGVIQSWNAAAERVFGYSAEQAVGRHISLIIPSERLSEEEQIVARLRAGERVDHFETVRVTKDGRRIQISLTVSPIKDDAGRVIGASKIARDITARLRAEAMLRENEVRLRLATQTGKVGIWECDIAGDRISWTDSLYAIHGIKRGEFDGTFGAYAQLVHPEDRERLSRSLERGVTEGLPFEVEYRAVRPDGQVIWLYTNATAVQTEGHRHVIGATLDITGRRQAEEALKRADRRKDEFLAILSHELRNPLAPIWTAAQVLKLKVPSDPDLRWSSEIIDRQMRHMVRLLEDLLDVSRISRNKLNLRKERLALDAVIRSAVETSRPVIDDAKHELSVLLPREPIYLDGDAVRLAQVFSNLLNNAAKYMNPGGRVVVRAERDGDRVSVTVTDQGIGIAADTLPLLFEMFSQVTPAGQRTQGGLGIGLSLARGLVELHGGTIEGRSEGPGKGSEFVVNLPLSVTKVAPTGAGEDTTSVGGAGARRRLLIVDDLKDSAESLAVLMRIKGHDVHTAYDGATAVTLAATLKPDVILLDIGLPVMNGYEACRRIREQPSGHEIFTIALTGWGQPSDRRQTEEAGFDLHLLKPVDGAALADLLVSLPATRRSSCSPQTSLLD